MPAPIASLALVTLGSGLVLGSYSYKRAKDAQKKDPKPKLTKALANDQDEPAPAADAKRVPRTKRMPNKAKASTKKAA